jgi:glyoxylase-like metal-dependent hydrolase (beta-lactamase superfamily II)
MLAASSWSPGMTVRAASGVAAPRVGRPPREWSLGSTVAAASTVWSLPPGRGRRLERLLARGPSLRSKVVIVERSMNQQWLSNTYLVADELGSEAAMIDAGGPVQPLLDVLRRMRFELTHVLLTHHHHDHLAELEAVLERHPGIPVLVHALERDRVPRASGTLEPGQAIDCGALRIEPLHTPGHTAGMVSLLINGTDVFTGDTLFKGSVGGVRAPGHTTYADLKRSIMETLLKLAPATRIHPGHSDPTTVSDELEHNPFVRVWRGMDHEGSEPCTALGEPATLILMAEDYDGGSKAWVRWPDGSDDIVPGSAVERGADAERVAGDRPVQDYGPEPAG